MNEHLKKMNVNRIIRTAILSFFLAFYFTVGRYQDRNMEWVQITESWFRIREWLFTFILLFVLFDLIINGLYYFWDRSLLKHAHEAQRSSTPYSFSKLFGFFVLFLIFWLPYLYIFYPGVSTPDTARQICMVFRFPTKVAGRLCTDGVNIIYSAHHPLLLTWLFGFFYKVGLRLNNLYAGLFLYTLIQTAICSVVMTYGLYCLNEFNVPGAIKRLYFIFVALCPIYGLYVVDMLSDLPFAVCCVLCTIENTRIVHNKGELLADKWYLLRLAVLYLATAACKKTGIYIVILNILILGIVYRKYFKKLALLLASVVFLFSVIFEGFVYKSMNVQKGGIQEILSVPFMQTARFLRDYEGSVSEEDLKVIDKVLIADEIAEVYDPQISDRVKGRFRDTASKEDLIEYFGVWAKEFYLAPHIYFESFFYSTYKYFYISPNVRVNWGNDHICSVDEFLTSYKGWKEKYHIPEDKVQEVTVESPECLREERTAVFNSVNKVEGIPVVGAVFSIGFYFSLLLIMAFYDKPARQGLYNKRVSFAYNIIIYLIPFLVMCTCLISPVNGSCRYALPVSWSVIYLFANIWSD